jgi:hypothetical protein
MYAHHPHHPLTVSLRLVGLGLFSPTPTALDHTQAGGACPAIAARRVALYSNDFLAQVSFLRSFVPSFVPSFVRSFLLYPLNCRGFDGL